MTSDGDLLQALRERPQDDALRLVYADWLEEQGDSARAELFRVCQAMRQVPVFSDDYWRLKARRNELRPGCPADWLAATGCDGSRYDPIYRDGIPRDWKGRWRLIREFAERWHGLAMGDVGGHREEIREEEERLGRRLPPSVREYIAYAHDVAPLRGFGFVHRDLYTMRPLEEPAALSIMVIAEGGWVWAVRNADLRRHDPPVYAYYWAEDDETRYVPAEGGPEADTLSEFVLGFVSAYKPDAGRFRTTVRDPSRLWEKLEESFPVRLARGRTTTFEGNGILSDLYPTRDGPGCDLSVCVHSSVTWERVPDFLWPYARHTHMRGGMFLNEEDRAADEPPAPPPLRGPATGEPLGPQEDDEIPF
jgi:uncharacterized protein (TIGR02996 family)